MAGIRGNSAWLALAKQSAKGTVATPVATTITNPGTATEATALGGAASTGVGQTVKMAFSGGNIGPTRETDRLAETDAARDQGALYVSSASIEGSPEVYARPDSLGQLLAGAFGGVSAPSTSAGPPAVTTHTFTPADTLPYYTIYKMLGGTGTLVERYTDCVIGSLTISAEAGAPLTASATVLGRDGTRITTGADFTLLTATTAPWVPMDQDAVFSFNDASISLWNPDKGGGAGYDPAVNIRSFEFTLENNIATQQTDDLTPYDIATGAREISLGFDMIFENITEYNRFHYGSASGTALSANIYTTKAKFLFTKTAAAAGLITPSLEIEVPSIAYEEFPVEPDPGGDPIVVSCRAVAQRATGVTNLAQAVLKNTVTTQY